MKTDAGLVMALVSSVSYVIVTVICATLATHGTTSEEAAVMVASGATAILLMAGTFAWLAWRTR